MNEKNKDLYEIIDLGLCLGNELFEIFKDGRIGISDFDNLMRIYQKLEPAIDGFGDALTRLKAMNEEEAEELKNYFKKEFDLENDHIEKYVEAAADLSVSLGRLFGLFKKNSS